MKLSIKTSKGMYRYRFVPLFIGTKIIDKEISARNLVAFTQILKSHDVTVAMAYGTLLGAVRENDFISHDEDIDLFMSVDDEEKLREALFDLREGGFEVCRYDRRGLISFMREGEYIDIYIFHEKTPGVVVCGREIMPEHFLRNLSPFTFLGHEYLAPREYERYLSFFYGDDWRIPVKYYHYELPAWKRHIAMAVQFAKEFLPDPIFYLLTARGDRKYRKKFAVKLPQYM